VAEGKLEASGARPVTFPRIRDLDLPTCRLEPVVPEASAVHRLDRGTHRVP
jgi:hypothetical protein